MGRLWKTNEIRFVRENYSNMSRRSIATALNRTTISVGAMVQRLGLIKNKMWKSTDISRLCELLQDGMTYRQIGEVIGATKKSVKNAVHRYKLGGYKKRNGNGERQALVME